jgi:membrane fusion protein, multidrug efflux system
LQAKSLLDQIDPEVDILLQRPIIRCASMAASIPSDFKDFLMRVVPRLAFALLVGTAIAGVACADSEAPQSPPESQAAPAVPIEATAATLKEVPLDVSVIGAVEAYSTVAVRSQITGELTAVNFRQGDDVQAGQELFALDRRPLEAALQQATANLDRDSAQAANQKVVLERYEQLVERGIVAREQRDTARTSLTALEATLAAHRAAIENAKVQLQYATIRAPISGRTGALMVDAGNLVRANDQTPLVTINQVTPIYVSFALPEAALTELRRYMARGALRVEASPSDGGGPTEVGRITFVDNSVDQTTGTINIKGTFANDDRALWPGQFVNVVVRLTTEARAVVVPTVAVQTGPEGNYVFLVKGDQTVELRPVTVARLAGTESVIKDGVAAGDVVVTVGHLRLVPGSRVTVRDPGAAKAGS